MSTLHVSVLNAFKSRAWSYREVPNTKVIEASFEAYHGKIPLHVQSFAEAHIVAVVSQASINVPPTHKHRAAELLMRANKELNLGNFEMEWDSGTVMFRMSNVFASHRYDENIIANLVHNAIAEMDRMTPYLGVLCQTSKAMLPLLDLPALLKRADLLPVVPEVENIVP